MTERLLRRRTVTLVAGVAILSALAAGCGDDSSDGSDAAGDPTPASPTASGMEEMGDMMMNDPNATPANELPDATEATFTVLDTAPPGSDAVAGTAWVAFGDDPGTTLTVDLTGLEPGTEYVSHLHAQACAEDNGGPHFKFDPNGSDTPPNEVHIGFTADENGDGTATITNQQAADAAGSVVIHPTEAIDNRLVCADL